MRRLEIVPFADEHLDGAARLLAERHERHQSAEPLLPAVDDFRWHVESVRGEGVAALYEGGLVGYLLGERREDPVLGRHVWVDRAGQAARDRQVLRDLYAAAAGPWVDADYTRHYVLVPALDELAAVWFALGFGQQQTHAARESGGSGAPPVEGLTVRRGDLDDLDRMAPLAPLIWEHQARSPVFAGAPQPPPETMRADWEEALSEPDVAYFIAERDGRAVGHALSSPGRPGLGTPSRSLDLAVVATLPEERGTGVGRTIVEHLLEWARAESLDAVVVDWRTTNLLSSRFFPRLGFRPTFLRLYRSIP